MNDIVPSKSGSLGPWLADWIAQGKIPGAVKAIAHVVGAFGNLTAAGFDIGTAKAEQIATGIRDETKARSVVKLELARQAAAMLPNEKELAARAARRWIGDEMRKQENREAVAELAAESIAQTPPAQETPSPSEDWLNIFSELAEKASSERARSWWSAVLSGEIRKPGTFAPSTMQILASIDVETAKMFQRISKWIVNGNHLIRLDNFNAGDELEQIMELDSVGLLRFDIALSTEITLKKDQKTEFLFRKSGIIVTAVENHTISIPIAVLTRAGRQILNILDAEEDFDSAKLVAEFLKRTSAAKAVVLLGKRRDRMLTDLTKIELPQPASS